MSKSSELDQTVKNYILDCISNEGHEETPYFNDCNTNTGKIDFLKHVFMSEYGYNVAKLGVQGALEQWISGLPSSFNIEYTNWNILELAEKWGSIPEHPTQAQEDKIIENWFNFIAAKTVQLFNGYRVPKEG